MLHLEADAEAERLRQQKEIAKLEVQVKLSEGKLANDNFVSRAPEAVVAEEKARLAAAKESLEKAKTKLAHWS